MSKIRTVKPELFRHEQLFEAEQRSGFPLRLIYIGLFTVVDAEGRFRWRPRQLKLDILPYDEINFSAALVTLVDYGFVERYEYCGEYYGVIPSWHKHQSINQREPDSVLPDPQQGFIYKQPSSSFPSAEINTASVITAVSISDSETILKDSSTIVEPCIGMHVQDSAVQSQISAPTMPDTIEPMPASLEMEVEMEVEEEMEGKGKWKKSKPPHLRAVPDPVVSVFEHWRRVMNHPKAVLDKQRQHAIQLALDRGYSVEDLCLAITGCSVTPHNCGHNDRGERYDGLHLILRSADQIDRFIRNAQHPPRPLNSAEQRLHGNIQAAQDWLQGQEHPREPR